MSSQCGESIRMRDGTLIECTVEGQHKIHGNRSMTEDGRCEVVVAWEVRQ